MNLRVKLLFIFSVSAFTALAFFGYVAYDTAAQESGKNESHALYEVFSPSINTVIEGVRSGAEMPQVLSRVSVHEAVKFALFDRKHNLIYDPQTQGIDFRNEFRALPFDETMGSITNGDLEMHWFTTPIADSELILATLYIHSAEQNQSFLSQMAVTLVFTAFIVLWCAAWSAMYVGGLIEKLKVQKVKLQKLATHDTLTGLPNRSLLNDRLEQCILQGKREKGQFALCFIDLNKFKDVNDTLGHHYGDKLLKEMSARLMRGVRASDTVARLGGDEFAVVLKNVDIQGAEVAANKLIDIIEESIVLKNKKYYLSASIGIAMFPEDGATVHSIIKHADDVMYVAKKSGKRYMHYNQIAGTKEESEFASEFDDDQPSNIYKIKNH